MRPKTDDAISSETTDQCECCGHYKLVKMYIIQTGEAAWICKECREGKPK